MHYADVVIKDTSAQHTDRTEIKGFECLNGITFPEEPILYKIVRVLWSVWWLSVRLCFGMQEVAGKPLEHLRAMSCKTAVPVI
jgi:hypothetical protein